MYINLKRVEFVITYKCSGKCKHCAVGEEIQTKANGHIQYDNIKGVLQKLNTKFNIESIMCFGGEPLLYSEDVSGIITEAKECNIPKRQIITNGYFNKSFDKIKEIVVMLEHAGTTDLLLSIDSFHQETIPMEYVYKFAKLVKDHNRVNIKVHPAWLVERESQNSWNNETEKLLEIFTKIGIPISSGNNISPSGNAIKYLSDYYPTPNIDLNYFCGSSKYTNPLDHIDTISIMPNGDVCICCFAIGNLYNEQIEDIIERYNPNDNMYMKILMNQGVQGLYQYAKSLGIHINSDQYHTPCNVCRDIIKEIYKLEK
jgi:organic radical activating enzyme